ncbi:YALI0E15752p [Yarrowia lipolytica CLIB122]|uniref:YALI0E15752p n=1 Tax=Yarrowia lipolytica (strain CLIB 122 / E 150) TaxID=284591 RepID=Q6C5R7_YARLI|nr:YALI0E15752p [Yarrowia lipolytica CLIB122]CAG79588.1 YALI0E15752p [Yarrowia lipolytica CLIB122]|eukprot:XP_503995.1 YALI0E15752p [Yarrowia lipolytica CLIB122]
MAAESCWILLEAKDGPLNYIRASHAKNWPIL